MQWESLARRSRRRCSKKSGWCACKHVRKWQGPAQKTCNSQIKLWLLKNDVSSCGERHYTWSLWDCGRTSSHISGYCSPRSGVLTPMARCSLCSGPLGQTLGEPHNEHIFFQWEVACCNPLQCSPSGDLLGCTWGFATSAWRNREKGVVLDIGWDLSLIELGGVLCWVSFNHSQSYSNRSNVANHIIHD